METDMWLLIPARKAPIHTTVIEAEKLIFGKDILQWLKSNVVFVFYMGFAVLVSVVILGTYHICQSSTTTVSFFCV